MTPLKTEKFSTLPEAQKELCKRYDIEYGFYSYYQDEYTQTIEDSIEVFASKDFTIISCLKPDLRSSNPFSNSNTGRFFEFHSPKEKNSTIERILEQEQLFYMVDKFFPDDTYFSVTDTKNYSDNDMSLIKGYAIYVPNDDIQEQYKKMKDEVGENKAYEHFIKDSNSILEDYSAYYNGKKGYMVSVVMYDNEGDSYSSENEKKGYFSLKKANKEKISIMENLYINQIVEKLAENFTGEEKQSSDAPPFPIETEELLHYTLVKVYDTTVISATYHDLSRVYTLKDGDVKPICATYSEWQTNNGVSPAEFTQFRSNKAIKEAIIEEFKKKSQLHHSTLKM